ncbi:MAG: hypothetical protein AAGA23_14010 [Pseudomonadota bacterium]
MPRSAERHRQLIAAEAARIVINQSVRDLHSAKLKAAERLGLDGRGALPRNVDVEAAVKEHLALFGGSSHASRLRQLREAALEGLQFFAPFSPRLVGPVLAGTADPHSAVNLHVFADTPDEVNLFLTREGVPFEEQQRRLRVSRERHEFYPLLRFVAGDVSVEVTIFPKEGLRQAPLSPVDGKPMTRAGVSQVALLLDAPGV